MSDKKMVWYKLNESDHIWWLESDNDGEFIFTFDKEKTFNLFRDYPHALSKKQLEVFDKENPRWKEFFSDRRRD